MQARSIQLPHMPVLTAIAAFLCDFGDAFRWALAMRGACRAWEGSGRRLDGEALRHIATSIDGGTT